MGRHFVVLMRALVGVVIPLLSYTSSSASPESLTMSPLCSLARSTYVSSVLTGGTSKAER